VIGSLVDSLVRHSDDGFLIPGLLVSGRDQKRSVLLSKRVQRHLRQQLKITDPNVVAAHSLRHTFTNALERAGVPEPLGTAEAPSRMATQEARTARPCRSKSWALPSPGRSWEGRSGRCRAPVAGCVDHPAQRS
jgi:integrase